MYLMSLNCALKNGQHGQFHIMYILPYSAKCDYRLLQEDTEAMGMYIVH